jgi:hypothetical protein
MIQSCITEKCLKYPICKSLEFIKCEGLVTSINLLKTDHNIETVHYTLLTHFPNLLQATSETFDQTTGQRRYQKYDINHPHKTEANQNLLFSKLQKIPIEHNSAKEIERKHFYYKDRGVSDRALLEVPPMALFSNHDEVRDKDNQIEVINAKTHFAPEWYANRYRVR